MTAVHWLIQENQADLDTVRDIPTLLAAEGHVAHLVRLERGAEAPIPPDLPEQGPLVCHGPGFMTRAVGHPILSKGLFFDPASFRWSAFRVGWGEAMLSRDGQVVDLATALRVLDGSERAFVRPDADSKAFEGGVYDHAGLLSAVGRDGIDQATPVVVAAALEIEAEWRFFVVASEIAACSEYRRWGRPSTEGFVPHAAIEIAADLATRWQPADIYCLDLASAEGRFGIVEANCFNASRFYAADRARILSAVNQDVLARHPFDRA